MKREWPVVPASARIAFRSRMEDFDPPNPLAEATMDDLKIVKVGLMRESRLQVHPGAGSAAPHQKLPQCWICTLRTESGGYFTGKGSNPASALDDALRALAEKIPL